MHDGPVSLLEIESVAEDLRWLLPEPFFFGASILPFYLDIPDHSGEDSFRPTEDIDLLLYLPPDLSLQDAEQRVEQSLYAHGWTTDLRRHRKNRHAFWSPSGVPVDIVMDRLYAEEDWPRQASRAPETCSLPSGRSIKIPTPAFYLSCKIAASSNPARWQFNGYYSHDLEDVALLLFRCSRLLSSLNAAPENLRDFIRGWARELMEGRAPRSYDALVSNLPRRLSVGELRGLLKTLSDR